MSSHPEYRRAHPIMGAFLRSRRRTLDPKEVGLIDSLPRDEPGLTRAEVAKLAGISITYLAGLEQGTAPRASVAALSGLARALKLDADDRDHLFRLADMAPSTHRQEPPLEHVAPGTAQLLDAMTNVPAVVMGARDDVLAWNRLGHRLLAPHLPFEAPLNVENRPNWIKMLFLDRCMRPTFHDWEREARRAITRLQDLTISRPEDLALVRLIGDLVLASDQFAEYWADPQSAIQMRKIRRLRHREVGDLDLHYETLTVEGTDQQVLTHCAEPGSISEARVRELRELTSS